jgi:hypothetical protein
MRVVINMSDIAIIPPVQASLVLGAFDIMKTKTCGEGEKTCRREEKTKEKYRKLWGNKLYNDIMIIHEADENAH